MGVFWMRSLLGMCGKCDRLLGMCGSVIAVWDVGECDHRNSLL
ncbi:hypothetical protein [Richelia sinica]|nr:hypothetical protein [Richelia sinica]